MSRPEGQDRNQDATCYVGNLDDRATDSLIWELMLQAGPIINVHLPKDRITSAHQGYGFAEYATENDAEYACKIMNGIKLFGKPLRVNKASSDRKQIDIGANLFVGNLDSGVDERLLWETFSAFGPVVGLPKIARDPVTNASKSYGFVSYDSFEASDAAIEALSNQILLNRPITVQYALKKDGKGGERHGTAAERLLAQQARKNNAMPVRAPLPMGVFAQPQPGAPQGWPGAPPGAPPAWGALPPGFDPSNVAMDPNAQYSGPPPGVAPPPPPPGMPVNGAYAAQAPMGMPPGPPPGMIPGPPPAYMTGSNNAPLGPRH